ncbi:pyridoxamine phosphate oxidase family protein [Moelleriella libera RCEF 2490]|uniref:Pyridoxamine phosphate oxidase family protein n=1 Tax=Moelleriella libera RCEF 2490 TaxID=1081109 RepID=A0A162ICK4_9HYPO|nr:pyridoxamine phosphate oxidase family protein [Moelleriella libera RCEF 2490]
MLLCPRRVSRITGIPRHQHSSPGRSSSAACLTRHNTSTSTSTSTCTSTSTSISTSISISTGTMKLYSSFPPDLSAWALRQPIFFTASAGTHARHINVSPKGLPSTHFAVLSPTQCAYIDRTGSGCETIAHAYENGRLTLMFISFGEAPRILRLFCTARIVEYDSPGFPALMARVVAHGGGGGGGGEKQQQHAAFDGARAIVVADIFQVQTSCGYGVPKVRRDVLETYRSSAAAAAAVSSPPADLTSSSVAAAGAEGGGGDDDDDDDDAAAASELAVFENRDTMDRWARKNAEANTLRAYQAKNNADSIDGLPGLRATRRDVGQILWLVDLRAWTRRMAAEWQAVALGFALAVLALFALRCCGGLL